MEGRKGGKEEVDGWKKGGKGREDRKLRRVKGCGWQRRKDECR